MPCPPRHTASSSPRRAATAAWWCWLLVLLAEAHGQAPPNPQAAMQAQLLARVGQSPGDATSWRLLGKLRLKAGDAAGAAESLGRASQLDPESAAAQFDLGQALLQLGQLAEAARCFQRVLELAPESDYARQAQAERGRLPVVDSQVQPASYEIKRFERAGVADRALDRASRLENRSDARSPDETFPPWSIRLESGLLYNTNVALSPTNRELDPNPRESFQGFFNPELEYNLIDAAGWRTGPTLAGYFTANEPSFSDFNLESYQPGAFVEHASACGDGVLVPRLEYEYTLDRFGGTNFGQRHSLGASVQFLHAWLDQLLYAVSDVTDFVNDGDTPSLTSRDGWTYTLGLSHTLHGGGWELTLGAEVQRADVDGSDYRYQSIAASGDLVVPLLSCLKLRLSSGGGYRDYFDAEIDPSRNEFLWNAGAELRWQITRHWSASLAANYERFDSDNELYTADRFVGGWTTVLEF